MEFYSGIPELIFFFLKTMGTRPRTLEEGGLPHAIGLTVPGAVCDCQGCSLQLSACSRLQPLLEHCGVLEPQPLLEPQDVYDDTVVINDDFRSRGVLFVDNHLSKLPSEQKAEATKKIVVNILPAASTGTQQPCDEGRGDFHRMKLALKADAQNQWHLSY